MNPDEQGADAALNSLVNMDGGSARNMADSLYRAAPTEALMRRSKPEREAQTATKGLLRTSWEAMKMSPGLSWIDPLIRGGNRGPNELAKSAVQISQGADRMGVNMPGVSLAINIADLANRGLSRIMGDKEYAGIARDGLVLNNKVEELLGPDTNEGFHAFVRDAAQFASASALLPMGGVELATEKAVGKFVAKKTLQKFAGKAVSGAGADAFGFDPKQERLSNLMAGWLENAPLGLDKPFKALATNPEDSTAKARFKAALEGVLLMGTIDGLIHYTPKAAGAIKDKAVEVFGAEKYDGPTFASVLGPEKLAEPVPDVFRVEPTAAGTHRVVPNVEEAAVPVGLPEFATAEEAQTVAASLGVATRNAAKEVKVTEAQATYFRQLAQWIHTAGKYEEFQRGVLNVDTGEFVGGYHDVNFRYDMTPEETGHLISSLSTVFRKELDEARIPLESRIDPKGGSRISNAETLAGTVRDHNFKTGAEVVGEMAQAKDVLDRVPALLLATRVIRQNLAQQAEVLARAMEASPNNIVAHGEFLKVTNTLLHAFTQESGVRSGLGRALQSLQIEVGKAGANLSKSGRKAFKRMLGQNAEPLEVLHFDLVDEPATAAEMAQLDMVREMHGDSGMAGAPVTPESVVLPADGAGRAGSTATAVGKAKADVGPEALRAEAERVKAERGGNTPEADMAAMEQAARNTASGKKEAPSVGKNTFTLVDEAQHRIDEALKKIDEEQAARAEKPVDEAKLDKQASDRVAKDQPQAVKDAAASMEVTDEDFQLAKDRLKAIRETISEKRAAGGSKIIDWSRYSAEDIADFASLHVERIKRLADEQRNSPMVPRKERTVHITTRQARQLARDLAFAPRNEAEREQVMRAVLGMARKVTEEGADAKPSWWERGVKYRAWSMLSAPTTAEVNFFSAMSVAHYRPIEGFFGAALKGDVAGMKRQASLLSGTLQAYHTAVVEAGKSAKLGTTILTAKDNAVPLTGALSWTKPLSAVLHISERMMTAGDEFASQLAYRGHLYMQAMEHARAAGITDAGEIAKRVQDQIEAGFNEMGRGTNPQAMEYALSTNLRNNLEGGLLGSLEKLVIEHPPLRILFPFVRIPSNLIRYQIDRTPLLGALSARNREAFAAGGMARDEAVGRQLMGTAFWTAGYAMASAGIITGGGPRDPELRKAWLGTDGKLHQPYSVKIGDKWVSYRRFEPLMTPLSIMADIHDMSGEMDEPSALKLVDAAVAGIGQNLLSKTYFKTLSDAFYAFGSGKAEAVDAFIDGLAGSLVPNIIQRSNPDDYLRTTRDFVDRFASRVPGWSETLEPRRNIFGEKVRKTGNQFQRTFNPFTLQSNNADDVDAELYRLGAGIAMPNPKKFGVDLRDRSLLGTKQSPYDRWMELLSTDVIPGKPPLREYLRAFIKSDKYQKYLTDGANGYDGSRQLAVEEIIRGYRAAAFAKMYQESKTLRDAILDSAKMKGAVLTGDPDMAQALSAGDKQRSYEQAVGFTNEVLQSAQ